jgi:hypothetical protein
VCRREPPGRRGVFRVDHRTDYRDDGGVAAVVTLDPDGDPAVPSSLFEAITRRHTNHWPFGDRPLEPSVVERFRRTVHEDEVTLWLVDDPDRKRAVGRLQAEADERLMDDPDYRKELGHWIGVGALGGSWLKARVGAAVVTYLDVGDREGRKNSKLVRSAPTLGLLATGADAPVERVKAGGAFERLALVASDAGVAVHPMSQTLERPETRDRLANVLGIDEGVPQHLFRLGYAEGSPERTPRWPVEALLG